MTTPEVPHTGSDPAGIGAVLRAARSKRGLSLAEMRVRTKIDARYLTALEADRFGDLPPLPFARGFLRTYAVELGLDPDPLVDQLAAAVSGAGQATGPASARDDLHRLDSAITPGRTPSPLRRAATTTAVVGFLASAILAVFFFQQVREFNRQVQPDPQAGAPPKATQQSPAPSPVPAPTSAAPAAATPGAVIPPGEPAVPQEAERITVDVQAVGRSWIRVQGEDGEIYEGIVTAGETHRWQSAGSMTIRIGNAAAVVVTVNGKAVGTLGRRGQVVSRTFTKDVNP